MILPATLLDHTGDHGFRHDERSVQVDVDHLAEFSGAHIHHRDALDDTGVVHQDIHRTQFLLDLGHQFIHLLLVGHVADVAFGVDTFLLVCSEPFVHELLFDVVERDFRACAGKSRCQCESDAVRGARYERDLYLPKKSLP